MDEFIQKDVVIRRTVPPNNSLFGGTVPPDNLLSGGTMSWGSLRIVRYPEGACEGVPPDNLCGGTIAL